jgi:hypothetical protein
VNVLPDVLTFHSYFVQIGYKGAWEKGGFMITFRCSECDKSFKTKKGLIWHEWHIHDISLNGQKPPKEIPMCGECYLKGLNDGHHQALQEAQQSEN